MDISAFSHRQEWAPSTPSTLPAQPLPVCTRRAQATSLPHCPAAERRGTTVSGETEAQGEVSQPQLSSVPDQTPGPAATTSRASPSSTAGKVPAMAPAPPTGLPHQPSHPQ